MEVLIKVGQLFLSLSLLIILHEGGHYLAARAFKIRVEKFYLFFDPWFSLFKKKIGDTTYGMGWLPLGGYVKISGMVDESMDKEQMKLPPKEWEFRAKPAWQRLIVMLGGIIVNVITAIVIYIFVMGIYGKTYIPADSLKDGIYVNPELSAKIGVETGDRILKMDGEPVSDISASNMIRDILLAETLEIERNGNVFKHNLPVDAIDLTGQLKDEGVEEFFSLRFPFTVGAFPDSMKQSAPYETGIREGDSLIRVDNQTITYFDELKTYLDANKDKKVDVYVKRGGDTLLMKSIPVSASGKIGIPVNQISANTMDSLSYLKIVKKDYSFLEAIPAGFAETWNQLAFYYKGFTKLFEPESGAVKNMGGFKAFAGMFPNSINWQIFWERTAFISIILAFMNLLPIPALDGGHVMFLLYEIITGRKPHQKVLEYAQMAGMILLFSLMIFANLNDWI